jgi:putative PIN family toxin of toxin-antitoxin system
MSASAHRVVFDCVVFAQALISTNGPAAECIERVRRKRVILFASASILNEIRELPYKISPRHGVTIEQAEQLATEISRIATIVEDAPPIYTHPIDPDDSIYINLAVYTESTLIVSRDRHLLNLMDVRRSEGKDFHSLFPQLVIMPPHVFVQQLREEERMEKQ